MLNRILCLPFMAALIVAACDKKAPGASPAAPKDAAPALAPMDAPGPVDARPAPEAEKLSYDSVLVVSDPPGGKVTGTLQSGGTIEVADGTFGKSAKASDDADPNVIDLGGKLVSIPEGHVLDVDHVSPDGQFAIASPHIECMDICTVAVWLIHRTGRRWELSGGVFHELIAWHPAGTALAFGSEEGLVLVELPSAKVITTAKKYTSPTYAPDGTLFVRGLADWHVYTYADGKTRRVAKGKKPPVDPEADPDLPAMDFPSPVELGPDGAVVVPKQ